MKKKYFIKRTALFLLVILIPTMLLFGATIFLSERSERAKLETESRQTMEAASTNVQLVLDGVLSQNNYLTSVSRMSLVLRRVLNGEELSYGDAIYLQSLRSSLKSVVESYEYVDSIHFYVDGSPNAISSTSGIISVTGDSDLGWLDIYSAMPEEESILIAPRTRAMGNIQTSLITVCQRMLLQKGVVAVDIDVQQLQNMLAALPLGQYQNIYLFNTGGELLGTTDAHPTLVEEMRQAWPAWGERVFSAGSNGEWVRTESGRYLILGEYFGPPGIYIVTTMSSAGINAAVLGQIAPLFVLLAIDVLVAMGLAYITTKRSFDQIHTVLKMFSDAENGVPVPSPGRPPKDEYDAIMNNIVRVFINNSYLRTLLAENKYRQENAELMALQLQINPHFLYNTLQTLDMEARQLGAPAHISAIVQDISAILKYALDSPQTPVRLAEEVDYLKKYVDVQKYRFGDGFIVYYELDEDCLDASVFRLMLQPLLENSLLHGLRRLGHRGYVKIRIRKRAECLSIRVIDNGMGMTKHEVERLRARINSNESRSIGMTNLNRRLLLRYGEESELKIYSKKDFGTTVAFQIPYEKLGG